MNTAVVKTPKRLYRYDAIELTAGEWAERFGLGYQYFYERIFALGDVEMAIAEIIKMLNEGAFDNEAFGDGEGEAL